MTWTNIPKPTGTTYTNVNPIGKTQYDQADVEYDDPSVFYDGVNPGQWTDVLKPANGVYGDYTWDEMDILWDNANGTWQGGWTKVLKPI